MDRTTLQPVRTGAGERRPVALALCCLASCLVAVSTEHGSVAARPPIGAERPGPSPVSLLRRTLQAHERLGSCYIESSVRYTDGHSPQGAASRVWMRRNDARHFVMSWEIRPGLQVIDYVSGRQCIQYVPAKKTYTRVRRGTFDFGDGPLFGFLAYIEEAVSDPEQRSPLARAKVRRVTYQRIPCYEITWDPRFRSGQMPPPGPPPSTGGPGAPGGGAYIAPFQVLVVGRTDGLVRKVISDWGPKGRITTRVITYRCRSRPYPPATFLFEPPDDVREEEGTPTSSG